MVRTTICHTLGETLTFGRALGHELMPGDVVFLFGTLGAGKTALCQGIALGLGVEEPVTSPTYALLQTYTGGRLTLNHFDLYRLEDPRQILAIGFEDAVYSDGVSVIEWPERLGNLAPRRRIEIYINRLEDGGRCLCVRRFDKGGDDDETDRA